MNPALTWIGAARTRVGALFPGLIASVTVAAAATFLSQHYGAPVMLFALLLGMAMNFLSQQDSSRPGIELASKHLLRVGVALLGLRITFGQIVGMGWFPVLLVVGSVVATIGVSYVAARLMGFKASFGVLSGGSVAICGASAAMALSTVLPNHPLRERATLFTVIGVSALSTLAMVAYPMLAQLLGLSEHQTGIFLGATIHDVAQVVGAGYGVSQAAGDTATVVKLLRVAMLMPVILTITLVTRRTRDPEAPKAVLMPWFVTAFGVLVLVGSLGWVPKPVQALGNDASRWALVISISAIGMKTRLQELVTVGIRPILLMFGETLFLASLVAGMLLFFG